MKFFRVFIMLVCIILFGSLWLLIFKKIHHREIVANQLQKMPDFNFKSINGGKVLNRSSLNPDKSTLFVFFDSNCEYCLFELEELNKNIEKFENTTVVLFSAQPNDTIKKFISSPKFENFDRSFIGTNNYNNIEESFGNLMTPTSLIYDKNKDLILIFKGATKITQLLEALKNTK